MKSCSCASLLLSAAVLSGTCQASEFQNLNFDEGADNLGGIGRPSGGFPIEVALPGWTLLSGSEQQDYIAVNPAILDPLRAALRDGFDEEVAQGKFALALSRYATNVPLLTLQQSGAVPGNAEFLVYRYRGGELEVQINGETIPALNDPGPFEPYTNRFASLVTNLVYDIARFAGQEVTLTFEGPLGPFLYAGATLSGTFVVFDSIQFLTEPPILVATHSGNDLVLSWPQSSQGYALQMTEAPLPPPAGSWKFVATPPVVDGDVQFVTVPIAIGPRFYRLAIPCPFCGQ